MGRKTSASAAPTERSRSSFLLINLAGAFAVLLLLLHANTLINREGEYEDEAHLATLSRERLFSKQLSRSGESGLDGSAEEKPKKTKGGKGGKTSVRSEPAAEEEEPAQKPASDPLSGSGFGHDSGLPGYSELTSLVGEVGSLYPGPTDEKADEAAELYKSMCNTKEAWDQELWFTNHNMSVERQGTVRDTLNLMGQHTIARLAVPDDTKIKPCKRLVVSVSTLPKRFERLEGLIRSLKWQTYPPDSILIAVPPFAPRVRQKYVIPDYIAKDPSITLVELPIDYGPVSKIAAAIIHEKDPDTCIITVDDDNQPREYFFQKLVTWAAVFPSSVIAESGWNVTCITGRVPYVCGGGYDTYLFVRQDFDFMCHPTSLPIYNFHQCLSPVDKVTVRATDVVMGVSNPLYRRAMFNDDFLDVAKVVAKRKVNAMLKEDEDARKPGGQVDKKAPDEVVEMAKKALLHPDLQDNEEMKHLEKLPPPSPVFMVDDVYISAYLSKKGVPRLVVPGTHDSITPIPEVTRPKKDWPAAPAGPTIDHTVGIENIDALHSESMFNEANYAATRYFHHIGWWGQP